MEEINSSNASTPSPARSRSRNRQRSHVNSSSPRHIKSIVTSMLRQQTFIGQYKATQRVDCVGDYRHVIEVDGKDPLVPILKNLRQRIREGYPKCWPGITLPGDLHSQDGYCFWVEHSHQLFEPYHYRITDVLFKEQEIYFVIKTEGRVVKAPSPTEQTMYDVLNTSTDMIQEQGMKFCLGVWALMTVENLKNTITFLGAIIAMLGAAGVYLLEYLITFMNATTGMLKVGMPAILKLLDIMQKVIGGFFVLFAMIWRDCLGIHQRPPDFMERKKRYLKY